MTLSIVHGNVKALLFNIPTAGGRRWNHSRSAPSNLLTAMLRRCTLGLVFPFAATLLTAQMHHVQAPQQVTRAVGVYEWTGDLKKPDAARLIPVSLFIDGHFEDAGVYLAQPVPLALDTGNVYAIQKAGDPIGTLDLDFARDVVDRRDVADDNPLGSWFGYGRYAPLAAEPKAPPLQASAHISAIVSSSDDDGQPHFINRTPGEAGNPSTGTTTTASATTPAPPNDPDHPVLHRAPDSSSTSSTDNAPLSPGTSVQEDDPDRPTLGHRDEREEKKHKKNESGSGVEPLSTSLNDDPDRPMLHRGKIESATAPPQLTGLPANLHQAVAVSDATARPQHVFAREWSSPAEKTETLAALEKLAQPLARQYMATNHLTPAAASTGPKLVTKTAHTTSSTHHTSTARHATHRAAQKKTPPAPLSFHDEQLTGFTLSYGGLPTFVYTADIPTTTGATTSGPLVRVTVVVQRLPSGELQTSLSSVTDDNHLDRTPWMRLIDAVDSDATHRASLLFELRAKASRQFALYSLVSAQAQQTFITGVIE